MPSIGIAVVKDGRVVYLREPNTPYYIGSIVHPPYIEPPLTQRSLYYSHATYLALYWSLTNPVPATLGPET